MRTSRKPLPAPAAHHAADPAPEPVLSDLDGVPSLEAMANWTPEERMEVLRSHLGDSYRAIRAAARVLAAMEDRGDDLSHIPAHMVRMLRRVNADQLLPEVMVRLGGSLRAKVAALPIAEQSRFVQPGATVLVVQPDGSAVEKEAQRLPPAEVALVFGDGYVRSPEEQRALALRKRPPGPKKRGRPKAEAVIDRERGGVVLNGRYYSKGQLLRWLGEI